jgi:hypothetical protein
MIYSALFVDQMHHAQRTMFRKIYKRNSNRECLGLKSGFFKDIPNSIIQNQNCDDAPSWGMYGDKLVLATNPYFCLGFKTENQLKFAIVVPCNLAPKVEISFSGGLFLKENRNFNLDIGGGLGKESFFSLFFDPNNGNQVFNYFECGVQSGSELHCASGSCCRHDGFCGTNDGFCTFSNCQQGFGKCEPGNRCGINWGGVGCSNNECCGEDGFCGSSEASCHRKFCQQGFGRCNDRQRCGKESEFCKFEECCGNDGFCGSTADYCGNGNCQDDYGRCDWVWKCGPQNNNLQCTQKSCCSQYGWCQFGDQYCGNGCERGFGNCWKGVTFYEDVNFGGRSATVWAGGCQNTSLDWNDKISSHKLLNEASCLKIFEHYNCQGNSLVMYEKEVDYRSRNFNDNVSSWIVGTRVQNECIL